MLENNIENLINTILDKAENEKTYTPEKKSIISSLTVEPKVDNADGSVAVKNGQLLIRYPKGYGKYPSISPGKNVKILADGSEVKGSILLTEDTNLQIVLCHQEPSISYEISLSPDKLEGYITVKSTPGQKLKLADHDETRYLVLNAVTDLEIPAPKINISEVIKKIQSLNIDMKYVNMQVLTKELESPSGNKIRFALGEPPVPSKNAYIEYLFEMKERTSKNLTDNERIDHWDKGFYQSVDAGTVLAIKHPPVFGKKGRTITGEEITVDEPKDITLDAGTGVRLVNDGQKAVAEVSGRPVLTNKKVIKVLSQLTISGNVDINTGHIKFKGDILINGNITEGLMVQAGGRVLVKGHVFSGNVFAGGDIIIGQNMVGGTLTAGGTSAFLSRVIPLINQLYEPLQHIINGVNQLKNNAKFCVADLNIKGDGNLIKLLLDFKFKDIPEIISILASHLESLDYVPEPSVKECVELLKTKLTALGPLSIKSLDELVEIKDKIYEIIKTAEQTSGDIANVSVKYSQNAIIEATGNVYVTGAGSYHTNIYAGKTVNIAGVCRGGEIKASGDITINQLGSSTAVVTRIRTTEKGRITANEIFPNSYLQIGRHTFKADTRMVNVRCFWEPDNGLIVKAGNEK